MGERWKGNQNEDLLGIETKVEPSKAYARRLLVHHYHTSLSEILRQRGYDQGMIESSRGDRGSLAADLKSGFLSSAGEHTKSQAERKRSSLWYLLGTSLMVEDRQ